MKTTFTLVLLFGIICSCEKQPHLSVVKQDSVVAHAKEKEKLPGLQLFKWFEKDEITRIECMGEGVGCLGVFEIVGKQNAYNALLDAIALNDQPSFFSSRNYGTIFNQETSPKIQASLVKGHLQFNTYELDGTAWVICEKPQHTSFELEKRIDKSAFLIQIAE